MRILPHDHDVERAYIASLLYDPARFTQEITESDSFWFHTPENKSIIEAMRSLAGGGVICEVAAICAKLTELGLAWPGMDGYVLVLSGEMPTGANLAHYRDILIDLAKRRKIIYDATSAVSLAYDTSKPVEEAQNLFQLSALDLSRVDTNGSYDQTELVNRFASRVAAAAKRNGRLVGLPSGLSDWDKKTEGLQPGHLVYIAGRPAMGKSALASGIAFKVASLGVGKVIIFSLEMTADQFTDRMICAIAMVNHNSRSRSLTLEEHKRINRAMSMVYKANLKIVETPGITVSQMMAMVMQEMQKGPVALVVVDYLQYVGWDGDQRVDTRIKVGSNSTRLKTMARQLRIPVLCLSQLNRNVEKREDRRPELGDLAESGQIEMDADSITFIFRPSYYTRDDDNQRDPTKQEEAHLIIGKSRFGETGLVKIGFTPAFTRFDTLTKGDLFDG